MIDFGRRARVFDWAVHIGGSALRRNGLMALLRLVWNTTESYRENVRGSRGQADGVYWLHSTDEFGDALKEAGFSVDRLEPCYRGYSDLAVCHVGGARNDA